MSHATLYCGDVRAVLATLPERSVPRDGTEAELAYCAGVIDSDGCISVKRSTYAMRVRGDAGQAVYSERVCVKQVEPHAVLLLRELFGGSFRLDNPSAKRGKPLFAWNVTDLRAARCLRQISPYLRIKTTQAQNCLDLRWIKEQSKVARVARGRGHMGGAVRPAHLSEQMEAMYQRSKGLNRVGVA